MSITIVNGVAALALSLVLAGCGGKAKTGEDEKVKTLGTVEVAARLTEVPEGAVFYRELYVPVFHFHLYLHYKNSI